jgi:hypothetical protein
MGPTEGPRRFHTSSSYVIRNLHCMFLLLNSIQSEMLTICISNYLVRISAGSPTVLTVGLGFPLNPYSRLEEVEFTRSEI